VVKQQKLAEGKQISFSILLVLNSRYSVSLAGVGITWAERETFTLRRARGNRQHHSKKSHTQHGERYTCEALDLGVKLLGLVGPALLLACQRVDESCGAVHLLLGGGGIIFQGLQGFVEGKKVGRSQAIKY
jgi:hypothetical protein